MANQNAFQVLAKLLYATSHNDRVVAELVPMLWNVPAPDEVVDITWEGLNVFYPARPSSNQGWECDRPDPNAPFPSDPQAMFKHMQEQFGDCFVLCKEDEGSEAIIVSPLLAQHLGAAPGGQLNLYAAVVYQLGMLLQSPYPPEDKVWGAEWKQWWASHSTAVLDCMIGGEIAREQAKAGLLGATSRGKGVYAAKVGGTMFNVEKLDGTRHMAKPGELYVSTSSPLAKLDGKHVIPWRNPMPFLDCLTMVAVGPATDYCKHPTVELDEDILPDSKIFAHPFQVSKTAGDVDGDGWQLLCLEKLLGWATKPENQAAIDGVPGLREGLMEYFLDDE